MSVDSSELATVVTQVWASLSTSALEPREPVPPSPEAIDVVAWVAISGAWDGVVTLRADPTVARDLTVAMFGGEGSPEDEDIADAWGEVANMVGGRVKASTVGQGILSLPTVVRGSSLVVPDGRLAASCDFTVNGGSLWVRLIERGSTVRNARG